MKKKIFKIGTVAVLMLGVTVSGCNKLSDFGDTNVNPGATTEPVLSALLTNVEAGIAGYATQTLPGLYAQYFSETQYTDASLYSINQANFTGIYQGNLYDLQNIINRNESQNMTNVARILQQYIFWTVTDRWGDVPYSEALQGSTPKYDTQEEIYRGMISTLAEVVDQFDNSPISGDVIFGGDVSKWRKTANSLRMLMAIQLSERFPAAGGYAATEFNSALTHSAGYINSNADNFLVPFPGGNYKNTWWNLYDGREDFGQSKTMTDLTGSLTDTRQQVFGGETKVEGQENSNNTSNIGVPYGWTRAKTEAWTSANPRWARILRGDKRTQSSPVYIITAAQVTLARAEAAHLGWTTENLVNVYNAGITQSFEQWGLTPAASYFTQSGVAVTPGGANNERNIAIQRYIASYPDGLQGWNIWRKSGYPALQPAEDATNTPKAIPTRLMYHPSEYTTNEVNVREAEGRLQGGNTMTARVWWDVD
jgi:hypothetical protein